MPSEKQSLKTWLQFMEKDSHFILHVKCKVFGNTLVTPACINVLVCMSVYTFKSFLQNDIQEWCFSPENKVI